MAARKKASRRGSGAVAKKAKAASGSSPSRKRKAVAAASARTSRLATKGKSARTAKAKSAAKPGKSEVARLRAAKAASAAKSASAAKRAASAKRRALATKAKKAVELKLNASQIAAKLAAAKLATAKAAPAKPILTAKPAGPARSPAAAVAKAPAAPVAKAPAASVAKAAATPVANAPAAPVAKAPAAPFAKSPSGPFAKAPLGKRAPVTPVTSEFDSAAKSVKPAVPRHGFKVNEFVVYPAHGVGQIISVEEQEVAGFRLELFVISFVKDKMMLRVPTSKVVGVGMRKLSEPDAARRALEILTGRARIKRTMWSRRAQEYEAKINSGDINAIAEVVRDLYRSEAQPEQSYSERQLYEAALDRMVREIAAVQKLSEIDAMKLIETHLRKSQRRAVKSDAPEGEDATVEEAA
jgi:CarD family transcriptional regulator